MLSELWYVLPAAFFLDILLGDPPRLPHPVRWMGWAIGFLEPLFRKIVRNEVLAGTVFSGFLIFGTWAGVYGILFVGQRIHPVVPVVLHIVLIYYAVSVRSLKTAAMNVYDALTRKGLAAARTQVSRIVGRDVANLNETGVASGAVESVAENLVDGVISPLFYAAIGAAPLAMAFKMISTLDSMIGYKNEKYRYFGKAAARIDDAVNFIPARLSVPVIAFAAQVMLKTGGQTLRTALQEGANHSSPNAGYPEACFAGALGIKLNGPNDYFGTLVDKPFIGLPFDRPETCHIKRACSLMIGSAWLWLALLTGLYLIRLLF